MGSEKVEQISAADGGSPPLISNDKSRPEIALGTAFFFVGTLSVEPYFEAKACSNSASAERFLFRSGLVR